MKYWGEDQEAAVIEFNTNDDIDQKHQVFCKGYRSSFFVSWWRTFYYTYNFNKIFMG